VSCSCRLLTESPSADAWVAAVPSARQPQGHYADLQAFLFCVNGAEGGDLNPHALESAATSRLCVCQFRHFRSSPNTKLRKLAKTPTSS
jgi:hypothetical protein